VAIAVQVFVASADLLGTTGLVLNVFVQPIVWFPVSFTTALSSALALNAVAKLLLSVGCQAISENDICGSLFTCNNQSVPS
jgi:hypothetical protein